MSSPRYQTLEYLTPLTLDSRGHVNIRVNKISGCLITMMLSSSLIAGTYVYFSDGRAYSGKVSSSSVVLAGAASMQPWARPSDVRTLNL